MLRFKFQPVDQNHISQLIDKLKNKASYGHDNTVGAKEILTLLKRRKKFTAKQGIKFHIPLSLISVGRV